MDLNLNFKNQSIESCSFLTTSSQSSLTTNSTLNQTLNSQVDLAGSISSRLKYLEEELANAQADKEFVWSLWRQLQAANPDITKAIGLVVQREKEKAELKDKKVLEILKIKDKSLNEYNQSLIQKKQELEELNEKLKNLESQSQVKEEEINFLKLNKKTFEDKEQMYNQMIRLKEDKLEQSEAEKSHLILRLRDSVGEVENLKEEKSVLKLELEQCECKVQTLTKQIEQAKENYDKLLNELNEFRLSIDQSLRNENEKLKSDSEKQKLEIENLAIKLNSNLDYIKQQDKLIKQLKQVQIDLQNTIKNQKSTFEVFESENSNLKEMYEQISKKYEEKMQKELECASQEKANEVKKLKSNEKSLREKIKAQQYEIDQLKLQNELHIEQMNNKQILLDDLTKKLQDFELKEKEKVQKSLGKNLKRSKSVASLRHSKSSKLKLDKLKNTSLTSYSDNESTNSTSEHPKLKQFYENICKAKDKELESLKRAHQRRLERLLSLEKENKLLKQQEEKELFSDNPEEEKKKPNLVGYIRKDTDCLSKEVKLLRNENESLAEENFTLKETLDLLTVKSAEQREIIQNLMFDLNINLKQKQEEFNIKKEKLEREIKEKKEKILNLNSEISDFKSKLEILDKKCSELTFDRIKFVNLSTKLSNENKRLFKKLFQVKKQKKQIRKHPAEDLTKKLKETNEKLQKEIQNLESKLKQQKNQNEIISNEVNNLKKKEIEFNSTKSLILKEEEVKLENVKKSYEQKLKQINLDLGKQIGLNKNLKTENEKFADKIKVLEEKLNHFERDSSQKKQLIDFYKKKIEEINTKNDPILNQDNEAILIELKSQVKKSNEFNEKFKLEIKNLKSRIQTLQTEKKTLEQKLDLSEKSKCKLEVQVKEANRKILDLESLLKDLEETAQSKLKDLSVTSGQTLDIAQQRVKYAFRLVENFECLLKNFYQSLIVRSVEIKRNIRNEKKKINKKSKVILEEKDENLKEAINLASSVLNMTTNELDDLLQTTIVSVKEEDLKVANLEESFEENEMKKMASSLLFEFEQCLNSSKKEKQSMAILRNKNKNELVDFNDLINSETICELISKRLSDLLAYERELACLKNSNN